MASFKFARWSVALALAAAASSAAAGPVEQVKGRVTGFKTLGEAFKSVNDGLRGGQVQAQIVQKAAAQISSAARDQYRWFPAGSGPQSGLKTAAKPEIWTRPAAFRAAQDAFARQAGAFQRIASSGDAAAIKSEARKLGATCKSCHDAFRVSN